MSTFTEKEVYKMATQIVAGLAANPAANLDGTAYDIEAAMKSATAGIKQAIMSEGNTITNDPFQSAVIDAANSSS